MGSYNLHGPASRPEPAIVRLDLGQAGGGTA